ncbi:unnamed protein product [Calypogeia fissa]
MFVTRGVIQSFVKYGHENSGLNFMSTASAQTCCQTHSLFLSPCKLSSWLERNPAIIHDAVMEKLAREKTLLYQVGLGILCHLFTPSLYGKDLDPSIFILNEAIRSCTENTAKNNLFRLLSRPLLGRFK